MTVLTTSADDLAKLQGATQMVVACLCAAWCGTCTVYRQDFAQIAERYPGLSFLWIDIEDDAALVDAIDVDNFPTVLLAQTGEPLFFGTLLPQASVLTRLIDNYLQQSKTVPNSSGTWPDGVVELTRKLYTENIVD